ncbi:DEP domain-containing protein DDB_G0279099-like isoform X2 [Wyeomyia smithii]|uniref:DEP domain-containing protein DDB_G0279099-like isoform X2 n=1 Tax=Wyeomyia smithii TaxID=174621 RepID=UPI0024681B15|nr:DEP domain-containing protein DDB_G0279099-like isoform X2 [Wyeomyia smithii]
MHAPDVGQSQWLNISAKWSNIQLQSQLVPEDPESKKDEFAFDNPAFKTGDGTTGINKSNSPLDPSWTSANKQNSLDKRKTVDDSCLNSTAPRLVSLRGSDFTGLGVEVYGGLKEGIFVKKVMPQGPAAGSVNTGDRITSLTIDFRHIALEDAMTILSYASPYNVQLECVRGEKIPQTQSPKPGHQPLSHPMVRSSSQSDMNTIERNSRKKLFPGEDASSTLKMEQNSGPPSLNKVLPTVHKENEKEPKKHSFKQQMKEMIEEKFQSRHAEVDRKDSSGEGKKGHKFGIRVFPPSVNDKLFGRSPTKTHADNENNTNIEKKESEDKKEKSPSPPVVKKRTKEPKVIPDVVTIESAPVEANVAPTEFQRQNSITSSGIKRDAAGIPQEMPGFMMQAANAAKDNRKSTSVEADNKRKGKAPKPPQNESEMDDSTVTMYTNLSLDVTDAAVNGNRMMNGTMEILQEDETNQKKLNSSDRMNFSDNFAEEVLNCTIESVSGMEKFDEEGPSNSSTPKSEHKKSSLTESMSHADHDSDVEQHDVPLGNKIELDSSDITVHQSSPSPTSSEEMIDDSNRRTASLGDLSKLDTQKSNPGSNSNTLERAQSLEISGDSDVAVVTGNTAAGNKKRKVSVEGQVPVESKEPKLTCGVGGGLMDGINSLQRLKGASAWGNLEDAINSGKLLNSSSESELKTSTEDVTEKVVTAMENGLIRIKDQITENTSTVVQMVNGATMINGIEDNKVTLDVQQPKNAEDSRMDSVTVTDKIAPAVIVAEERKVEKDNEHVSLTTINMDYNGGYPIESEQINNKTDQVKITNYDTNIPDDVKVSRYPFGSLERPKSDVLKKLLGQKEELENTPSVFISGDSDSNKITIENSYHDVGEPISLTLINNTESHPIENDLTESSQASPVFSSNTNGVSSINISSMEIDLTKSLNSKPFTVAPKFSLDNIVTISTDSSQPSSIILIDDEKLDFSLQTLDDFDDSIEHTNVGESQYNVSSELNKTVIETNPPVAEKPITPNSFVTEITVKTPISEQNGKLEEPPKVTKKPPKPEKPTTPPSRIPVERRMSSEHSYIPRNTEIKFTTSTYDSGKNHDKRPLGIDQIRSNFERSNSKPDVRSFERSNSKPDVRPFERSNSKPDVRPFERSNSKPDVRPFERSNSKTDVRSVLERSNSKTEIPVLIRRTSIPSINLNSSSMQATTNGNGNGTKASPSRIPVFNSTSKLNNGHDSPRSPPPFVHNNNNNNNGSINNNHVSNKVSVSITSIKNQSKHPSGKFGGN